jgi:hypothetical protein
MVVASIALLVALGGTSVAAVNQLAANSVGTSQLKSNAVTTPKIKNGAVNASKLASNAVVAAKIASNAVTTAKIAGNAVTNAKIANGTIQPADLSASAKTAGPPGTPGASGPQGPSGPAGVAAPGYVAQVTSQTSGSETTTDSTSFVPLAGSSQTFAVPTGETARIYAIFTAESACSGISYCSVRITVDGNELNPVVGGDFAFVAGLQLGSHAIARSSETLAAGNHTVQVEIRTNAALSELTIDDWALVVFRTKVS